MLSCLWILAPNIATVEVAFALLRICRWEVIARNEAIALGKLKLLTCFLDGP